MQMFFTPVGGEGCDAFDKYYVWLKEICCLLPSISNKLGMINHYLRYFLLDTKPTFSSFQYSEHFTAQLRERMCTFENVQL